MGVLEVIFGHFLIAPLALYDCIVLSGVTWCMMTSHPISPKYPYV
jgi:hypothetical protein